MGTNEIVKYIKESVKIFSKPPKNPFEFISKKISGIGGSLFRYTSCNRLASNLDERLTYFNVPRNFNDPFDCNFDSDLNGIMSNILKKFFIERPQTKDIIALFKSGQYVNIKTFAKKTAAKTNR